MKIKDAHCHYGREFFLGTVGRLKLNVNSTYENLSDKWDRYGIEKCVLFPVPRPTSASRYILESLPLSTFALSSGYICISNLIGRNLGPFVIAVADLGIIGFFAQIGIQVEEWPLFGGRISLFKKEKIVDYSNWNEKISKINDERVEFVPFISHRTSQQDLEQLNVKGIKFYEPHGEIPQWLLEYLNSKDMNLVLHLSRRSESDPQDFLKKVGKYPRINFQVAHLAVGIPEIVDSLDEYDNLYLDTSACSHWQYRKLRRIPTDRIISENPEKTLFGSDEPVTSYRKQIEQIERLNVGNNDKEKILFRNFEKLWE